MIGKRSGLQVFAGPAWVCVWSELGCGGKNRVTLQSRGSGAKAQKLWCRIYLLCKTRVIFGLLFVEADVLKNQHLQEKS